jgi:para-aminobenzoate synthetase component 1
MNALLQPVETAHSPESLVDLLRGEPGLVLLRSACFDSAHARYSFVAARPFLTFRSFGARCAITQPESGTTRWHFGNPWRVLDALLARYELLDVPDCPFPLGGCFGYWGYGLKNFVEPRLARRAEDDLELPDCHTGFYGSLVAFDHRPGTCWIIATGVGVEDRETARAAEEAAWWHERLHSRELPASAPDPQPSNPEPGSVGHGLRGMPGAAPDLTSNVARSEFVAAVERAQRYIRAGDIYQVNLAHRLSAAWPASGWELFRRLLDVSPAPFAAYVDGGEFQLVSSSPELFLRLSGRHILTRPIKGTRPRAADPTRDAQLMYELQTSPKELAELVMITDLLRNDLGRVCEFGSVQVPELVRLERYAHVQHLVSTIEGRLRPDLTHLAALAACFPGGSVTGAPKVRAMEIIDELEPLARGPYTGCLGYLGFNRESQLAITIRTAVVKDRRAYFHVGAGIVADSVPEAEYEETLAKGRGFSAALQLPLTSAPVCV